MLAGCGGIGAQQSYVSIPKTASHLTQLPYARQANSSYKVVYSFKGKTDGYVPTGEILSLNALLYGVTYAGGNDYGSLGTIYKMSKFGKETVLYRFRGGTDGSSPNGAGLIDVNGALYGTTGNGGNGCTGGCGTVYKTSTDGRERVVYSFRGGSNGVGPSAPLIDVKGMLYGTTQAGGTLSCRGYGCGVVFKINPDGSGYRVLHRFAGGTDGDDPLGLIEVNGKLYGTTANGGSSSCKYGCGTVFEMSMSGVEQVEYAFKGGRDGTYPNAGLIAVNGSLYGTTYGGGNAKCGNRRCGTVFEVSPSGAERVIYRFNGGIYDGANPQTPLFYLNGTFYGTTGGGGHCYDSQTGCGTIYALYAPGKERVLHTFLGGLDGEFPSSGLIEFEFMALRYDGIGRLEQLRGQRLRNRLQIRAVNVTKIVIHR